MVRQPTETLILNLSEILIENQVDTAAVEKALRLICDCFAYDAGMIYEIDHSDHFHLREYANTDQAPLRESFTWETLTSQHRHFLTQKIVSFLSRTECNTSCEEELLDLFCADNMAISPVTDENLLVYGLIVFVNRKTKELPEGVNFKSMISPLCMFIRYVAIRMYQNKLSLAQLSLESILDNTGIDIYVNDFYNHDILYVNKSMAAPYGGQEQFVGKKCWQVLFPGQKGPCEFCPEKNLLDQRGEPTMVYSWDYQRPFDGSWFRVFSAAFRWVDGRMAHVVSSADITDNKQKEALIEYMANYDSLTNLPNRRMLVNDCEERINKATETEQGYLLFFDIDGFKAINDNHGHDAGDEFLIKLGKFFSDIPLLKDSIYRNGGDEFVAIIGGEDVTKDHIKNLANFILARFQKPWTLKCGDVYCNTSIGVACYPEDGRNAEDLLRKADMSMYKVKKSGGGGLCFGYEL